MTIRQVSHAVHTPEHQSHDNTSSVPCRSHTGAPVPRQYVKCPMAFTHRSTSPTTIRQVSHAVHTPEHQSHDNTSSVPWRSHTGAPVPRQYVKCPMPFTHRSTSPMTIRQVSHAVHTPEHQSHDNTSSVPWRSHTGAPVPRQYVKCPMPFTHRSTSPMTIRQVSHGVHTPEHQSHDNTSSVPWRSHTGAPVP